MSILLTNEIIFNYVKENPGLTSKEIADYFNTKASLLNKQFSDKHGHIYDKSWRGIYNIKGIGHSEYMHYVDEAVTYEDSSEPRYTAAFAISKGVPARARGVVILSMDSKCL